MPAWYAKGFTYMALALAEPVLEANQFEEQHGFRGGRRLGKNLVGCGQTGVACQRLV